MTIAVDLGRKATKTNNGPIAGVLEYLETVQVPIPNLYVLRIAVC